MALPVFSTTKRGASRLATRLIVAFMITILATTAAAGIPAYWLIRNELDQQAWSRIVDAQRVTTTLLETEEARLVGLARLIAQRPTLQRLLKEETLATTPDYLHTLQSGAGLDILTVQDDTGRFLGGSDLSHTQPTVSPALESASYTVRSPQHELVLLTTQPVIDDQSGELLGYVTVGLPLNDAFTRRLATETGFEQSVILDGQRTATSLPDAPPAPTNPDAVGKVMTLGQAELVEVTMQGAPYYTALLPLANIDGQPVALIELALPVTSLATVKQRALAVLALSTLLFTSLGSVLGAHLARRLTAPLQQLTTAATRISRGDLTSSVPIPTDPVEITTLATALEESRANIHHTLDELSLAKTWSENLIRSIVEGVVTFDTQGRITFFSGGTERIMGCSSQNALGQLLNEVFRLAGDGGEEQFLERIPPRGGKRQIEVLTCDGRSVTLAVTGARLVPPDSDQVQVALVLRDVTEEEAVRNLQSQFLANITHEFRTPLAALNASIELLMDKAGPLAQSGVDELLNSLHLSVLNLQTLIDNLLESSSIEAGRFTIRRRVTDLNRVIAEAIQVVQPLLTVRQQSLSLVEPTQLPSIEADPTRLMQVLVNLLSNASKYGPPGTPVDLNVEKGENHLRLAVTDRGPGIPLKDRTNLFHRFVRLDTPEEAQYGIGLGLSVAKAIVEGHGGQIGVGERPGGGSIFWFTLPIDEKADKR